MVTRQVSDVVPPHSDDPGPTPPSWAEQEWCDGGGTCEHPDCIWALEDERLEAMETSR